MGTKRLRTGRVKSHGGYSPEYQTERLLWHCDDWLTPKKGRFGQSMSKDLEHTSLSLNFDQRQAIQSHKRSHITQKGV